MKDIYNEVLGPHVALLPMKDAGKCRFAKRLCDTWGEDPIIAKDILIDPVLIYDGGMFMQELISLWIRGKT